MNNLVDWEYYNSHFPNLSEEDFKKIVYKAERVVLKRVSKNMDNLSEEEKTSVRDCICDIINNVFGTNNAKGLASVSNDGYSESYVNMTEEQQEHRIESIIKMWLNDLGILKGHFIAF